MIPKSGDRAGLDASGVATAEFSSGNARDTPLRVGSYRKMARECRFHTVCSNYAQARNQRIRNMTLYDILFQHFMAD